MTKFTARWGDLSFQNEKQTLDPERLWFAIYTMPRHEKRTAQHFDYKGIEHFLPLYYAPRSRKKPSKEMSRLPLFPGYVFVKMSRAHKSEVLNVPGVLRMVTAAGGVPAILPTVDMETL